MKITFTSTLILKAFSICFIIISIIDLTNKQYTTWILNILIGITLFIIGQCFEETKPEKGLLLGLLFPMIETKEPYESEKEEQPLDLIGPMITIKEKHPKNKRTK